jgi:uncharacterized protein (TIGR03435 family)
MDEFAGRVLIKYVPRPVINQTGLAGRFDVRLKFSPSESRDPAFLNGAPAPVESSQSAAGESIFSALQSQLGLQLKAENGSVDVLMVDQAASPWEL